MRILFVVGFAVSLTFFMDVRHTIRRLYRFSPLSTWSALRKRLFLTWILIRLALAVATITAGIALVLDQVLPFRISLMALAAYPALFATTPCSKTWLDRHPTRLLLLRTLPMLATAGACIALALMLPD